MNLKTKKIKYLFLSAFFTVGFFAFSSQAKADYFTQGIVESKNMLSGATVTAINGFQVTATIPSGTAVKVKFSQDKVNYYSSGGIKEGWDNCANGTTSINLSGLGWTGGLLFYKLQLTTTDAALTPTVTDAQVDYDGTAVPAPDGNLYPVQGAIVSTNLLAGGAMVFDSTVRFAYNAISIPFSTSASVQFSQDGVNWYSSNGTLWGEDALTAGSHLDSTNSLSLSALNWNGATSFYYKFNFYSPIDDSLTPVISDAGLIKTDQVYYSVGQSASDLKTGTPTLTITASSGTFSVAQTGNIGVGDRVTYNTNQIAYISAKTDPDSAHWSLVTATGGIPGDVTNATVNSITHEFTSLSAAVTAASNASHINNTDLVAANVVLNIPCYYDSDADTAAVTVSGYTTGANNYIKIYTPSNTSTEANNSQRHSGKPGTGYLLNPSLAASGIVNQIGYTKIIGLTVTDFGGSGYASRGIYMSTVASSGSELSHTLIFNEAVNNNGYAISFQTYGSGMFKIFDNIVYGVNYGIRDGRGDSDVGRACYVYNNTVINASSVAYVNGSSGSIFKNNIAQSSGTGFSGSFAVSSDYNISSDVTAPGANSKNSTTVKFADAANKDFHLDPNDTAAKNAGVDLSADENFAFNADIDGQTRGGGWDIGADEGATAIYYSVGQNTNDHKTGSPTVDISNGTATFSTAQIAMNMGVGDKVTYNTSSVAYISAKISQTQWKLIAATGSVPADATNQTVNSIAHAFNSLSAAEAGAPALLGTSDLVAGNFQLNFPCYYDSGADTTAVMVSGYMTAPANYIRIYTPVSIATEVNQSQRHQGKWDDTKYVLSSINVGYPYNPIGDDVGYLSVDGLQITYGHDTTSIIYGIIIEDTNAAQKVISISNNIIKGDLNRTYASAGIRMNNSLALNFVSKIFNNIIYDIKGSGIKDNSYKVGGVSGANYVYNNIISNCTSIGITNRTIDGRTIFAKNNIVQNCVDGYDGFFDASSNYNISNLATDAPGANSKNSTTVTFADATNKNFHLASADTAARNAGVDLQRDTNFAFDRDIDGQTRSGKWDIGADQFFGTVVQTEQSAQSLDSGLVGHWTFNGDDISGATVKDVSGNNNHGTINGATVTPGKLGQGMNYSSAGNVVTVSDNNSLEGMAQFSISAWINPKTAGVGTNYGRIVEKNNGNPYVFAINANNLECSIGLTSLTASGNVLSGKFNNWHLVNCIYDGANVSIYMDGILIGSAPKTDMVQSTSSNLTIGNNIAGDRTFNGNIDDVRIYNRALSANEIGQLYHQGEVKMQTSQTDKLTDGLVGLWSFDGKDVSGTTAFDRSGSGNNGTISGQAKPVPGKIGQSMFFDGVNEADPNADYINAGSASSLDDIENSGGGGMTVSAWIYPKSSGVGSSATIFGKNFNNGFWRLSMAGDTGRIEFMKDYDGNNLDITSGNNFISFNRWNYLVMTWDGSSNVNNVHLYNNGVEEDVYIAKNSGTGNKISDASESLMIGGNPQRYIFDGKIDESRIYNKVLSVQEIRELYNTGKVQIRK